MAQKKKKRTAPKKVPRNNKKSQGEDQGKINEITQVTSTTAQIIRDFDKRPLRLGVISRQRDITDLRLLVSILGSILPNPRVTVLIYGWNGILPDGTNIFEGLNVEHVIPSDELSFHSAINSLELDAHLMPLSTHPVSEFRGAGLIMEMNLLHVPAIASLIPPANMVITHGETGWLVANNPSEWKRTIDGILDNPPQLLVVQQRSAMQSMENDYSHESNIIALASVYGIV
jgi:glycosyltransferase involved in cell wall biosynthesis